MDGIQIQKIPFDTTTYLRTPGVGRTILNFKAKHALFSQGGVADAVFYIQSGRAKLTVVSKRGKEATVTLLTAGDFAGEEAIAEIGRIRVATASAITVCVVTRIGRDQMLKVLREEHAFSDFFLKFMLARGMRTQADLIDQLFNSSEKRLARTLLLMAEFGQPGEPEMLIPSVTQETLAEMIGTTRSRVSYFMNRFRRLGYISYNGRIQVHKALLSVVLHDQLPEQNAMMPTVLDPLPAKARKAGRTKPA
jgi:CRP/FNR family cyclic AMP-dependent transcriptional regulator